MEKQRILYVDDMKECFDNTLRALGEGYEIDWRKNPLDAIKAIQENISQYDAAIFDVNLFYDPSKPDTEQTTEGLDLIKILRNKVKATKIYLPIFCVSSNNNRESALEKGADEM
ncbi:unnamed protein product [marine sediment metagenome]|uniref:Response regulatory domain-containing protein n=1 Tax=marine sediment metagenome TaxID=412755 RepID=X1LZI2_9ZZZZ